ncbi:hypothetical protein AVEN_161240-1 [Araneus ventricosus]|uniref:Uncharacterized protein n=1 Tax=Araneus ventricosus TaxID=182803 RepID=A0A4Y2NS02_ARAVE|nr:hypothetical protein AVEN_161240-1 [Araneus ventricosus]
MRSVFNIQERLAEFLTVSPYVYLSRLDETRPMRSLFNLPPYPGGKNGLRVSLRELTSSLTPFDSQDHWNRGTKIRERPSSSFSKIREISSPPRKTTMTAILFTS